jgi:hypothetical protein
MGVWACCARRPGAGASGAFSGGGRLEHRTSSCGKMGRIRPVFAATPVSWPPPLRVCLGCPRAGAALAARTHLMKRAHRRLGSALSVHVSVCSCKTLGYAFFFYFSGLKKAYNCKSTINTGRSDRRSVCSPLREGLLRPVSVTVMTILAVGYNILIGSDAFLFPNRAGTAGVHRDNYRAK